MIYLWQVHDKKSENEDKHKMDSHVFQNRTLKDRQEKGHEWLLQIIIQNKSVSKALDAQPVVTIYYTQFTFNVKMKSENTYMISASTDVVSRSTTLVESQGVVYKFRFTDMDHWDTRSIWF